MKDVMTAEASALVRPSGSERLGLISVKFFRLVQLANEETRN